MYLHRYGEHHALRTGAMKRGEGLCIPERAKFESRRGLGMNRRCRLAGIKAILSELEGFPRRARGGSPRRRPHTEYLAKSTPYLQRLLGTRI